MRPFFDCHFRLTSLFAMLLSLGLAAGCGQAGNDSQMDSRGQTGAITAMPSQIPPLVCEGAACDRQAVGQFVSVSWRGVSLCTASLVTPTRILTASHCIQWENVRDNQIEQCWFRLPGNTEVHACKSIVRASIVHANNMTDVQRDFTFIDIATASSRTPLSRDRKSNRSGEVLRIVAVHLGASEHKLIERECRSSDQIKYETRTVNRYTILLPGCETWPGYSGGPILTSRGRLLGLLSFKDFIQQGTAEQQPLAVGTRVSLVGDSTAPRETEN